MSRRHIAAALVSAAVALGLPSAAGAATLSFPLMGWWPMNEGSGQTVNDWSGHGNNGMLGSTPGVDANDPSWVPGVFFGSALQFTDSEDYVTIPSPASLQQQNLTVAAWVKGTSTPGNFHYVMSLGGQSSCALSSWGLYTGSGGGMAFYIADSPSHVFVSPAKDQSIWDGKWHHVAGTFDGSTVRLYVDGVQVGNGTPASGPIDYSLTDGGGTIGGANEQTCNENLTFNGDVDGVQVWSVALPVDRIWAVLKPLVTQAR
jgi:hypothetical protein